MKARNFSLTHAEIASAREIGITFSPRVKNKLVCNQVPRFGRLNQKQANILRKQVWVLRFQKRETRQNQTAASERKADTLPVYLAVCPECRGENSTKGGTFERTVTCQFCFARFKSVPCESISINLPHRDYLFGRRR